MMTPNIDYSDIFDNGQWTHSETTPLESRARHEVEVEHQLQRIAYALENIGETAVVALICFVLVALIIGVII